MTSLGLLSLRSYSELEYFTGIASRGDLHGITVHHFTPDSIDPETELVEGVTYNNRKHSWVEDRFPIPEVIYDRCFYPFGSTDNFSKAIVNWLKRHPGVTFLGFGLPNKRDIHKMLQADSVLSHYIPETMEIQSPDDVLKELIKNNQLILKPQSGAQGRGILLLSKRESCITVSLHHTVKGLIEKTFPDMKTFSRFIRPILIKHRYILQPYLPLLMEGKRPFDVRVLLQKEGGGSWKEQGRGLRIGPENHFLSNLHTGGMVDRFDRWLAAKGGTEQIILKDEFQTIMNHLPNTLEQHFGRLFEIGIDIGVATDGSVWILDTNSKPGHKMLHHLYPDKRNDLYDAPLLYANHLLQTSKVKGR